MSDRPTNQTTDRAWRVVTVSYPECNRTEYDGFVSQREAELWGCQQNFTRTASWYVEEVNNG